MLTAMHSNSHWVSFGYIHTHAHTHCMCGFIFVSFRPLYLRRMSLTANGTSGAQLKFSHLIKLIQNQEKSIRTKITREDEQKKKQKRRRGEKTKQIKFSECWEVNALNIDEHIKMEDKLNHTKISLCVI